MKIINYSSVRGREVLSYVRLRLFGALETA